MKHPDIMVLGVGRSGTSFCCEVWHKYFGVCFGHDETMLRDFRGETVYEDRGLKKMIKRVVRGEVALVVWLRKFDALHKECNAPLTGVKLLDFGALPLEDILVINPKIVIRTYRPFVSNVESWVRYRRDGIGRDEDRRAWAKDYVLEREAQIRELVPQLKKAGVLVREVAFMPEHYRLQGDDLAKEFQKCLDQLSPTAPRPTAAG